MKKHFLIFALFFGASLSLGLAQRSQTETKIKPTDTIIIRISGVPQEDVIQVSQTYNIASDGKFPLPLVGRITAAGLTPSQLGMRVEQTYKAAQIFTKPTVVVSTPETVAKGEVDAIKFISITGEVRASQRARFDNGMTLVGAIATAGGFSDWADKRRVRLLRRGKTTEHDLTKISIHPELDIALQPDDKVIVIHR